jgi:S1-C subfamily serine protease
VADAGNEFEEFPDDDARAPLLPPEDRLWRHPSELALHHPVDSPEAIEARTRWLSSTPTRAGAWSAGLVGAVLATGVVLIGTHLTNWINPRTSATAPRLVSTTLPGDHATPYSAAIDGVIPAGAATTVAAGMTLVVATIGSKDHTGDGVVIRTDGMILVPASVVAGATDVQVIFDPHHNAQQFDAAIVGIDSSTGLAVLHVDDTGLTPTRFAAGGPPAAGQWTWFEWVSPAPTVFSAASVQASAIGARLANGPGLLASVTAEVSDLPADPVGAVMVDARLRVTGMVAGRSGRHFVEVPPSVLERVGAELIAYGQVRHGWLGVTGVGAEWAPGGHGIKPMITLTTNPPARHDVTGRSRVVFGVKVTSVRPSSAAEQAGIHPGDMILSVNGQKVATMADLQTVLYFVQPHQAVTVRIERGSASWACEPRLKAAA